jgi:hypothetical protein
MRCPGLCYADFGYREEGGHKQYRGEFWSASQSPAFLVTNARGSMTAESRAIGSAEANFFGPHFDPAVRIQKQKKGWQLHLARLTVSCYGNVY